MPEVFGELLDKASAEPSDQPRYAEAPYSPAALLRLWLRRHPDNVVERD